MTKMYEKPKNVADHGGLVRKIVRRAKDADPVLAKIFEEDLMQQAFLWLVKYADKYDPTRAAWSKFAFILLLSKFRAMAQSLRVRLRLRANSAVMMSTIGNDDEEVMDLTDKFAVQPFRAVLARDEVARIISVLPADYREIVIDYHIDGLTMEKIAAKRGRSVAGVSKALELSMRRLQVEASREPDRSDK